jgi:hypothetical protein
MARPHAVVFGKHFSLNLDLNTHLSMHTTALTQVSHLHCLQYENNKIIKFVASAYSVLSILSNFEHFVLFNK